jgi:dTDP-4-amino-4,6-dideoxygalactose transaminase
MHSETGLIPFHRPSIGREEIREVVATLKSGWLTSGARTGQFEAEFREYVEASRALAVNSGTAALHLALAALRIGSGDEVITTPLTFCATVNTILQVGATPVLADVGPDGNIDPASIAERITSRTRAILPVHLGGLPCAMDEIWEMAHKRGLYVIEDAAHAVGAKFRDRPIGATSEGGSRSDAVAFSFYATKNLTTGEGGMVTCGDPELYARMRVLCLHGISKDAWNRYGDKGDWYYEVLECGYKYNLSDVQSALGLHQLRKQEHFLTLRKRYARLLGQLLGDVEEIELPPNRKDCRHAWHLYSIRLRLDRLTIDRAEFIRRLRQQGVNASVHFIPIFLHPFFKPYADRECNYCPAAAALYPRLVSLPLYPALTVAQVERIAAAVRTVIHRALGKKAMPAGGC